jgi:NADH:ubiquinone oxidoreductase subunit 4 (subunit M)
VLLVAIGFPGSSVFVGFFMIAIAALQSAPIQLILALAGWALLGGALIQWFHQQKSGRPGSPLRGRLAAALLPLLVLLWIGGIMPGWLLETSEASVAASLAKVMRNADGDQVGEER